MDADGLVTTEWGLEGDQPRREYRLTEDGACALEDWIGVMNGATQAPRCPITSLTEARPWPRHRGNDMSCYHRHGYGCDGPLPPPDWYDAYGYRPRRYRDEVVVLRDDDYDDEEIARAVGANPDVAVATAMRTRPWRRSLQPRCKSERRRFGRSWPGSRKTWPCSPKRPDRIRWTDRPRSLMRRPPDSPGGLPSWLESRPLRRRRSPARGIRHEGGSGIPLDQLRSRAGPSSPPPR